MGPMPPPPKGGPPMMPKGGMPPPPGGPGAKPPDGGDGQQVSQKEAFCISGDLASAMGLSEFPTCANCNNFQGDSCSKVAGDFEPTDRCLKFFSPKGEPDADDAGGPPDNDQDDSGPGG